MNAMLYSICTGFAELWEMGREREIQNENIRFQQDSNPRPTKSSKDSPAP